MAANPTPYQGQPILLVGCGRNPNGAGYSHGNGDHSLHWCDYHNQIPAAVQGYFTASEIINHYPRDSYFNGEHCYTIDLTDRSDPHYHGDFGGKVSSQFLGTLLGRFDMVIIDSAGTLKRLFNNEDEYTHNSNFVPDDAEDYGVGSVSIYLNNCLKVLKPGGMLVMALVFMDNPTFFQRFQAIVQARHDVVPGSMADILCWETAEHGPDTSARIGVRMTRA